MFEVTCLNSQGESVDHFTQWDMGQFLIIEDTGLSEAPEFHFCNKTSSEALVVASSMSADGVITVNVPNSLLRESYTIIAYMYLVESVSSDENDISAKTLHTIMLPVRPRVKPSDYTYVENIDMVTLSKVNNEITSIQSQIDILNGVTYTEISEDEIDSIFV